MKKIITSETRRLNQAVQFPFGVVKFSEKGEGEIPDEFVEQALLRDKTLSLVEDKKEIEGGEEAKSSIIEKPEKESLVEVTVPEPQKDVETEEVDSNSSEDILGLIKTMKKEELVNIAKESGYPTKEWVLLKVEDLRNYLIEKIKEI